MSLALSLHDAGFSDIHLFESAAATRELGVGINVLPHAVRELTEMGLGAEIEAAAVPTAELVFYSTHGQRIWAESRGRDAGYRWPQLSIHRGRLLGVLHSAVVERLGADRLHHDHHLETLDGGDGGARASFVSRSTGATHDEVQGAVLVGCDGIHSVVRSTLVPREGPPQWNGVTMWRGVTEAEPFLSGRSMFMAGHFARRVVVYPISAATPGGGRSLINWVAEYRGEEDRTMPPQDWDHTVDIAEVLAVFGGFDFEFCDVPALIAGAEAVFQYPMVDRDPIESWTAGRVTLLGDAAHPMYPVGSNGASQAIIDARVLARDLVLVDDVDEALAAYESVRRPATAAIVLANRQVGPERCMEIVHERAPNGFDDIDDVIGNEELEEISESYRRTAGFSVEELNTRPSLSVRPGGLPAA